MKLPLMHTIENLVQFLADNMWLDVLILILIVVIFVGRDPDRGEPDEY